MYKLWFRFAKKRSLVTRRDYFYVYNPYSNSGLRAVILVIVWLLGYALIRFHFLMRKPSNIESILFIIIFVLISEGLTFAAGFALQKTAYILELPWYLKGRNVFIKRELNRNSCKTESNNVTNFAKEDGDVTYNCKRNCEHKDYDHFSQHPPVEKLSAMDKCLILASSPLWLIHLLFDRGNTKVISPAEYNKVEYEYGRLIDDGWGFWEAGKDAIVNAVVCGIWSVSVGCFVLLRLS